MSMVGSNRSEASAEAGRAREAGGRHLGRPRLRRAKSWEDRVAAVEALAETPGFARLREEIITSAHLQPDDRVLDIGAGTGLLALAVAPNVSRVWALDISPAMCRALEAKLQGLPETNVEVLVGGATALPLATESIDVVLSNYCFHHLRDADKDIALGEVARVLRPGGRLVFGDMMFRVGLRDARDRRLIANFVGKMMRRGPAGVLRLLKNVVRVASGRGEHPASVEWWQGALADAGFAGVTVRPLDHEGGIAVARRID